MAVYDSFHASVQFGNLELKSLEWRETTPKGMDGRSWRIREASEPGHTFDIKLSGSVCGTMGLGGVCEDITPGMIKPVLIEAIQRTVAESGELPRVGDDFVVWVRPDDFRAIGMEPPP